MAKDWVVSAHSGLVFSKGRDLDLRLLLKGGTLEMLLVTGG